VQCVLLHINEHTYRNRNYCSFVLLSFGNNKGLCYVVFNVIKSCTNSEDSWAAVVWKYLQMWTVWALSLSPTSTFSRYLFATHTKASSGHSYESNNNNSWPIWSKSTRKCIKWIYNSMQGMAQQIQLYGAYYLFLLPVLPQARPVHSWWLAPLCGMGFHWQSDCSLGFFPTYSTLAWKLFFLAVQGLGALLSSNLEEALYKSP